MSSVNATAHVAEWGLIDLSWFCESFPLYPESARAVWTTARQLTAEPHSWTHLALVHAEDMQCYLLRGVSPRLAKQQHAQRMRRRQREEWAAAAVAEQAAAAAAHSATSAADGSAAVAPADDGATYGVMPPELVEETAVPDWQFVLPSDAHRVWSNDTFPRLFTLLDVPSLLVSLYTPPSYLTFLAMHRGVFHVLPRSVLTKDDSDADKKMEQAGEDYSIYEGMGMGAGGEGGEADVAPAHQSRRKAKKRRQQEHTNNRVASFDVRPQPAERNGANSFAQGAPSLQQQQQQPQPQSASLPPPHSSQPFQAAGNSAKVATPSAPVARRERRQRQQE